MRGRPPILVAFMMVMVMGVAVYLKLWTTDYAVSSVDAELIRRQFDLANRDAMNEAAEWRQKYVEEARKATKCDMVLAGFRDSLEQKVNSANVNQKLAVLQKENTALLEQVKVLNQRLEVQKSKCRS